MPRVAERTSQGRAAGVVNCCRCPNPIVKGESYYEWAIKSQRGGTVYRQHTSHGHVRPSQLTHSKMSGAYAAIESAEDSVAAAGSCSEVAEALREAANSIEEVAQEYQDGIDAMPEGLQQGSTAQESGEKVEALNDFAQTLNDAADDCDGMEEEVEEPAEGEEAEESDGGLQAAQDRANEALGELSI